MRKVRIFLLILLILIFSAILAYLRGTPRLLTVEPAQDSSDVPTTSALKLTFSRPMQAASVRQRLIIKPNQKGSYTWQGNTLIFTPEHPWLSGKTIQVSLTPGSLASGWLALPVREALAWSFTIGHPRLVYQFPAEGTANLYIYNPVDRQIAQLTDSQGGVLDFTVAERGTAIYYSVKASTGGSAIYRLALPAQSAQAARPKPSTLPVASLILECPDGLCRAPEVSPDGDYLAYERTAFLGSDQPSYPQVWLMPLSADGGATAIPPRLAGVTGHQTLQPLWSTRGLLTFYDTNQAAFITLNPKTGEQWLFANQTGQPGDWAPAGSSYVAPEITIITVGETITNTDLQPIGTSHLISYTLNKPTTIDLSRDENLEDTSPAFSPDGKTLAFARKFLDVGRWTPGRQIWIMKPDGSQARQLTNSPNYNHYEFAWSPDNDLLAFVRFDQTLMIAPPEVWLVSPANGQATKVMNGGYAPQWIP